MAVYTFEGFLTDEECKRYIAEIDEKKDKTLFTLAGQLENDMYIDWDTADYFYRRLVGLSDEPDFLGAYKYVMTAKYKPGDQFNIHTDTGSYYSSENGEKSRYTMLIYLNDTFEGGQTEFFDNRMKTSHIIQPTPGMALVFDIDLFHRGLPVESGTKYWIGCEIIGRI